MFSRSLKDALGSTINNPRVMLQIMALLGTYDHNLFIVHASDYFLKACGISKTVFFVFNDKIGSLLLITNNLALKSCIIIRTSVDAPCYELRNI